MDKIKVAIIGAGSSYTPELVEGLAQESQALPIRELAFMDIDRGRLELMAGFCRRYLRHHGSEIDITTTTDRLEAIKGARFIVVQIRVGGNTQRILDEKIPLKYGLVGQETTGPGGMMKALRTIPVMLEIARDVEQHNPRSWIINYTNPTGLVTEAVTKCTEARIAGLCSGGLFPVMCASEALGVLEDQVHFSYVGLNHLSFAYDFAVGGRPVTDEEFSRIAEKAAWGASDPTLFTKLRLIPSPYLQYYYNTSKKMAELLNQHHTRGEEVQTLEEALFHELADETRCSKPEALARRGGGGYSQIALGVMKAIHSDEEEIIIVNVQNRGAVRPLPDDAVVEIPCVVNGSGIFALNVPEVPRTVVGLIAAVKNYEQLAVEAAVTGDRDTALLALMAHPLVQDYEIVVPLLDELLEVSQQYLPKFQARG